MFGASSELASVMEFVFNQVAYFGTDQWAVTLCDREGNRRSGIALAVGCTLHWSNQLRAQGL